jgi:hypothetical protein
MDAIRILLIDSVIPIRIVYTILFYSSSPTTATLSMRTSRPACVAWCSLPTHTGFDLYIHQWYFSGYLRCWLGHTSSVHRSQNPEVLLVRRLPCSSWDAISLRAVILLRRYYFTSSDVKFLLLESELVLTIIIGEQKEYKIKIAYKKNQLYILLFLF